MLDFAPTPNSASVIDPFVSKMIGLRPVGNFW
jgi:hypothetical protein